MNKSISNFLLSFLAGAAAGAIAGILFAPDKGTTTRQNIRKKILDLSDDLNLGLVDLMDEMGLQTEPPARTKRSRKQAAPAPAKVPKPKRPYTRKPKLQND